MFCNKSCLRISFEPLNSLLQFSKLKLFNTFDAVDAMYLEYLQDENRWTVNGYYIITIFNSSQTFLQIGSCSYVSIFTFCFRIIELGLYDRCALIKNRKITEAEILAIHSQETYQKLKQLSQIDDHNILEMEASKYDAVYFNKVEKWLFIHFTL